MHQNKAPTTSPELAESGTSRSCILCGNKVIQQLSRYSNLGIAERKFLSEHFGKYVPEDSYICKKHWIEAKRYHSDPYYIPKWKNIPDTQTSLRSCIHPQCTDKFKDKLFKPSFTTINKLEKLLGVQSSSSVPFLLCPSCYSKVYRHFNPTHTCSTCGATPKPGQKFHRHSPDPVIISKYINDKTGTDNYISADDCICTSCYNAHCSIVRSIKHELNGSDEMLSKSIEQWEATCQAHKTDQLTKAILTSVINIC